MAGALDSLFKNAAKAIVADLGTSLDTKITYVRKASPSYSYATGALTTTDTSYSNIKVPIEFVHAEEEEGNRARARDQPHHVSSVQAAACGTGQVRSRRDDRG